MIIAGIIPDVVSGLSQQSSIFHDHHHVVDN